MKRYSLMSTSNKVKTVFASVGSRFSMDRMLSSLEQVVDRHPDIRVKAQAGNTPYTSSTIELIPNLSTDQFELAVTDCDVFVSHAGMGNILLAAQLKKPLIIMPRRVSFGEHISDHQVGTAQALTHRAGVVVADNAEELELAILAILNSSTGGPATSVQINDSRGELISSLRAFIDND
ncbi:glycosyltransferase [Arenicella xantha]|uniref:UDP-N-acetylglucosamine transferase subunit ALG13 n=1 Tax=Arenicella xantha TaxID=644221 RepID=A0A395JN23_9GAMM|nr:glycosyltransferase [Arenicella xantha]RBP52949.1 UDP-N-acetylglucosamine transferase subunit ALG13 [Arenicella xantha]